MHIFPVIISIFSVFIIGFIVGKTMKLDIRSLSAVAMNIFFPILVFLTFYKTPLTEKHIKILISILILHLCLFIIVLAFSRIFHSNKKRKHAMLLSSLFMNSGNYGVPLVLFSMGEEAYVYALMIMVMMDFSMNTLGVFIAASGSGDDITKRGSLLKTLKMPVFIASVFGILFQVIDVSIPSSIENTLVLLSEAAIPLIMVVLGIQLSTIKFKRISWVPTSFIIILRLVISPMLMFVIITMMDFTNTVMGTVLILISAMPSAANTTMFSVQFNVDPDFVSLLTLLSTILSVITVPIWFLLIV